MLRIKTRRSLLSVHQLQILLLSVLSFMIKACGGNGSLSSIFSSSNPNLKALKLDSLESKILLSKSTNYKVLPKEKYLFIGNSRYIGLEEGGAGQCGPKAILEVLKTVENKSFSIAGFTAQSIREQVVGVIPVWREFEKYVDHDLAKNTKSIEEIKQDLTNYIELFKEMLRLEGDEEKFKFFQFLVKAEYDKIQQSFKESLGVYENNLNQLKHIDVEKHVEVSRLIRAYNLGKQPNDLSRDNLKKWCEFLLKFPQFLDFSAKDGLDANLESVENITGIVGLKNVKESDDISDEELDNLLALLNQYNVVTNGQITSEDLKAIFKNEDVEKRFPKFSLIIQNYQELSKDRELIEEQLTEENKGYVISYFEVQRPFLTDNIQSSYNKIKDCKGFKDLIKQCDVYEFFRAVKTLNPLCVSLSAIMQDRFEHSSEEKKDILLAKLNKDGISDELVEEYKKITTESTAYFDDKEIILALYMYGCVFIESPEALSDYGAVSALIFKHYKPKEHPLVIASDSLDKFQKGCVGGHWIPFKLVLQGSGGDDHNIVEAIGEASK